MPAKPQILKRGTVARSRLFRADEIHLRFSNGEERTYEKLCSGGPGAVLIVPLLDANTVLLVREYAAGLEIIRDTAVIYDSKIKQCADASFLLYGDVQQTLVGFNINCFHKLHQYLAARCL